MVRRPWVFVVLVALAGLAGCVEPADPASKPAGTSSSVIPASGAAGPEPDGTSEANTSRPSAWHPASTGVVGAGCDVAVFVAPGSEEDAQEHLPEGYEPAGKGMAAVELRIVDCREGALVNASDAEDRVSIPGPWRAAWVGVWVAGAPQVDVPDRVYAWEVFVDGDQPASLWARAGLAVQAAAIEVSSSPWDVHAAIRVNGSIVYAVDAPTGAIPWPGLQGVFVPYVNETGGVERSWMLAYVAGSTLSQHGGGVLEVSGGVLGSIFPASATGAMPVSASLYPASVQVSPVVVDS